jgi:hypothetical protein
LHPLIPSRRNGSAHAHEIAAFVISPSVWACIGNGHLPRHAVAEISEPAAQPLLIRVQDAAQHEFAAGVDNFDAH